MKKSTIVFGLTLIAAAAACVQAADWPPEKQKESEFTERKLETFLPRIFRQHVRVSHPWVHAAVGGNQISYNEGIHPSQSP